MIEEQYGRGLIILVVNIFHALFSVSPIGIDRTQQ